MTRFVLIIALALVALGPAPSEARGHHRGGRSHDADQASVAGAFDYYLLSLSWSPQHCAERTGRGDDAQCGTTRRYSFIVHGLWPQDDGGGFPESCEHGGHLDEDVIAATYDAMPSRDLIRHEWAKHGTCSGLSPERYFGSVRDAFHRVTIPERFRSPDDAFRVTAAAVRDDFRTVNPDVPADGIAVLCTGRFLSEVRLCLTKDGLHPRACGARVKDTCFGEAIVRPIR
ncbi:MAG TPA: ribonuclease T2 [Candidatus Binatia bacterium]|jgi:ribonuclease T2